MLDDRCSPEQIRHRLRHDHPDRPELHVSHETIYQALYVQGRGELRRELARALRTGRTVRKPRRTADQRRPRFTAPMIMIGDRPAQVDDRAVPGHWEGDLIIGADQQSAIGTLVERTTRYVMLVHLGHDRTAEAVRDALITTVTTLPAHLTRSLTWDQGSEMSRHHEFTLATDIPVYFCDPHSPWQRGSNENTNGLLRQYFPKGTDLAVHSPEDLAAVAAQLNRRPRKRSAGTPPPSVWLGSWPKPVDHLCCDDRWNPPNTPLGGSGPHLPGTACARRWGGPGRASIVRSPSRSSPPSKPRSAPPSGTPATMPDETCSPTSATTTTTVYIRHSTTALHTKSASAIVKASPSRHKTRCPVFGDNLTRCASGGLSGRTTMDASFGAWSQAVHQKRHFSCVDGHRFACVVGANRSTSFAHHAPALTSRSA